MFLAPMCYHQCVPAELLGNALIRLHCIKNTMASPTLGLRHCQAIMCPSLLLAGLHPSRGNRCSQTPQDPGSGFLSLRSPSGHQIVLH